MLSILRSPLSGSLLYAGTAQNGVFMSADAGQTWVVANSRLPATSGSAARSVRALVSDGQYVYAATDAGIYCATAGAMATDLPNWIRLSDPSAVTPISLLAIDASSASLFAATSTAAGAEAAVVYVTSTSGLCAAPAAAHWTASRLPAETVDTAIGALAVVPAIGARSAGLLVGAANRIYAAAIAPGMGVLNWTDADPFGTLFALGAIESLHYSADFSQTYACSAGQLFLTSDPLTAQLNPWLPAAVSPKPATAFTCTAINSGGLAAGGPAVLALATSAGVYTSLDGTSFTAMSLLGVSPVANAVAIAGSPVPALYVAGGFGVASQSIAALAPTSVWTSNNGPTTVSAGGGNGRLNNANVTDSVVVGATLFAAVASAQYSDVLSSPDSGAHWASTGLSAVVGDMTGIPALAADPSNRIVYAGTTNGLYARSASAGTWAQVASATIGSVRSLARGTGALYVGTDAGVFVLPLGAAPSTAVAVAAGLSGLRVSALRVAGRMVYAGTFDFNAGLASVSVAADVATGVPAWSDFATGAVGPHRICSLEPVGASLLAATRGGLVSVAMPGGSWTSASNGISDPNGVVTSLFSDGTTVFAATGSNGVYALPVGATFTWTPFSGSGSVALPSMEVHQLRAEGTVLYVSTAAGLAAFDGITASVEPAPPTPPTPPAPTPALSSGSGGGAMDWPSLLALALLAGLTAASRVRQRKK